MPLLSAVAPTMLNVISKMAKEQKLNSADIARLLQADRTATSASAKPEVQAMVNEALHIGDRAERLRSTSRMTSGRRSVSRPWRRPTTS